MQIYIFMTKMAKYWTYLLQWTNKDDLPVKEQIKYRVRFLSAILVRIRIRGSVSLIIGSDSGSGSWYFVSDLQDKEDNYAYY